MKITRNEVYKLIDGERDYQDEVVQNKYTPGASHPVAAEILMMEDYLARARRDWTDNKGDETALSQIRKVAALAVRCMEHHGAPARKETR